MTKCNRRSFFKKCISQAAALTLTPTIRTNGGVLRRTKRVILVALAGGIRSRETFGSPANIPNMMRLRQDCVIYPRTRAANLGHYGATLAIFTGVSEARGIRDNTRGSDPTLFEYLRKDLGLASGDIWVSTSGGVQEANISYSLHPDYGPRYGANTVDGDGIFNAEFKGILDAYGRPREMGPEELALLERMRSSIGPKCPEWGEDAGTFSRVERFLLDELKRGTQEMKGIGASDAKALRVARNLLAVFRPRLLAIVLRDADVAHNDFNSYVQVIRRNDDMLGELWDAVRNDPELADSTAIFILPEFGRDKDLNARRGLDHGDGSDDLQSVSLVCWGPDFRKGQIVNEEVRTIDVCSSICDLLGSNPRYARGQRLPQLKA